MMLSRRDSGVLTRKMFLTGFPAKRAYFRFLFKGLDFLLLPMEIYSPRDFNSDEPEPFLCVKIAPDSSNPKGLTSH